MNSENEKLAKDIQQNFLHLLNDYFPKDLLERVKQNKKIKILSIGCGRFREAKSIFDYFSFEGEVTGPRFLKLYGIEIDEELLELAKNDSFIKARVDSIYLKKADASKIESYQDWLRDGLFDLVIIRHPEITFNTDVFIKTFSLCDDLLIKSGYLFCTTHFENEKEAIKLAFKLLKFNVITDIKNNNAPSIQVKGEKRYVDKFLLILQLLPVTN